MSFVVAMWGSLMGFLSAAAWPAAILIAAWWARPLLLRTAETFGQTLKDRDWQLKVGSFEAKVQQATDRDILTGGLVSDTETKADATPSLPSPPLSQPSTPLPSPSGPLAARFQTEAQEAIQSMRPEQIPEIVAHAHGEIRAQLAYEYIFNRIFKSQVQLLQHLNVSGGTLPEATVEHHYETVQKAYPNILKPEEMSNWLRYIEAYELVTWNGKMLTITPYGQDFLVYLVKAGLNPETKGL